MRPPYYILTSRCRNQNCPVDEFATQRKTVQYVSTSGRLETTVNQVCPTCRCWGTVIKIEAVPTQKGV